MVKAREGGRQIISNPLPNCPGHLEKEVVDFQLVNIVLVVLLAVGLN